MDWDQATIAHKEEARCARGFRVTASIAEPFAGGWLCYEAPGSWANSAVGAGLSGPPAPGDIERLIGFYAERGAPARVQIAPTVDRAWVEALGEAGFVVQLFENVLARPLPPDDDPLGSLTHPLPEGLRIRQIDPGNDGDVERFAWIAESGFSGPDGPTEAGLVLGRRMARSLRVVALLAELDGEPVGSGAASGSSGEVGALFGVSVLPRARRRGIQQALIAERLRILRERGCELAIITSEPGIATERNARRLGFALAYTRVQLHRPLPSA